jgi:protein-disulfide isomerase
MSLDKNNDNNNDINNDKNNNNNNIMLKRSTFVKLAVVGISALMVSSFLAGFTLQIGITPTYITLPSSAVPSTLPSNMPSQQPSPSIAGANNLPAQQQQQQPSVIPSVSVDNDPIQGNNDAPVTLVEFSDYQCPFCKKTFDDTMPQLKEKYVDSGKIKHVFRDYPLPFHQNGIPAAIAAECANEQGKFWDYHNILFSKQTEWENLSGNATADKFKEYAANNITNIDTNKFNSCIDSQKYKDEVDKDIADGSTYGVSGTPTFYIGNEEKGYTQIVGAQPLTSFENIIKQISSSSSSNSTKGEIPSTTTAAAT